MRRTSEDGREVVEGGRKRRLRRGIVMGAAAFWLAWTGAAQAARATASAPESPQAPVDPAIRRAVLGMNGAMIDKIKINEDNIVYLMGYGPSLGTVDVYYRVGRNPALVQLATNVHVKSEGWWEITPASPIPAVGYENPEPITFSLCWTPMGGQKECVGSKDDPALQLEIYAWSPEPHATADPAVVTWNLRASIGNWPWILRTFILDGPDRTGTEGTNDIQETQANLWDNPRDPQPSVIGVGYGEGVCDPDHPLHYCLPDPSLTVSTHRNGMGTEFPFVLVGILGHDIGRTVLKVEKFRRSEIPTSPPLFQSLLFGYPLTVDFAAGCSSIAGGSSGAVQGTLMSLVVLAGMAGARIVRKKAESRSRIAGRRTRG